MHKSQKLKPFYQKHEEHINKHFLSQRSNYAGWVGDCEKEGLTVCGGNTDAHYERAAEIEKELLKTKSADRVFELMRETGLFQFSYVEYVLDGELQADEQELKALYYLHDLGRKLNYNVKHLAGFSTVEKWFETKRAYNSISLNMPNSVLGVDDFVDWINQYHMA